MSLREDVTIGRADVVRSPADVLRLVVAGTALVALLLVEALFGRAVVGFTSDLLRGLDAIDEQVLTGFVVVVRVVTVVVLVVQLVIAVATGRWRVVATVAVAVAAAAGLFWVVEHWIDEQRAPLAQLSDSVGFLSSDGFPSSTGLAIAAAVTTAMAPWSSRRTRRWAWTMVLALTAARFVSAPVSGVALAALVSGWFGGAVAVAVFGAPSKRPARDDIVAGLRSVGLDVSVLEPASVDARGSTPYFGVASDGRGVFVKVLGRDERDADLLFRLYRFVQPRNLGDERPFSSLRRAVEHEALVALTARQLGVRTPPFAALCDADPDGFVLAYETIKGRSLDKVEPHELTDAVLGLVWEQVALIRRHRLAHRDLRLANVFLDDSGTVWLIDFGFAELAASDVLLATDLAELVTALSLKVGAVRAVRSGLAVVGHDALASGLQRLRPKLLSGATRTALKHEPLLLEEIRRAVAAETPPPASVELAGG